MAFCSNHLDNFQLHAFSQIVSFLLVSVQYSESGLDECLLPCCLLPQQQAFRHFVASPKRRTAIDLASQRGHEETKPGVVWVLFLVLQLSLGHKLVSSCPIVQKLAALRSAIQRFSPFGPKNHQRMSSQNRKPYLDKICSGPHLMSQRPGFREDTVVLIPPLRHTGIRSEMYEQEIPITTPEGRLTRMYRQQSKKRLQPIYRDHQELSHREVVFKKGHKQFIDKVLVDMEEKKRTQFERQMKHWRSSKSDIGFNETFNSLDMTEFRKQFDETKTGEQSRVTTAKTASTVPVEEDYGADFEDPERSPSADKRDRSIELHVSFPPLSPKAPINERSSSICSSHSSHSAAGTPSRKMRPFSRMSLFENMLDTVEPPKSPSKRFGSLADMTASFRDSFNQTQSIASPTNATSS